MCHPVFSMLSGLWCYCAAAVRISWLSAHEPRERFTASETSSSQKQGAKASGFDTMSQHSSTGDTLPRRGRSQHHQGDKAAASPHSTVSGLSCTGALIESCDNLPPHTHTTLTADTNMLRHLIRMAGRWVHFPVRGSQQQPSHVRLFVTKK